MFIISIICLLIILLQNKTLKNSSLDLKFFNKFEMTFNNTKINKKNSKGTG